jgi:hypothetical protein
MNIRDLPSANEDNEDMRTMRTARVYVSESHAKIVRLP